MHANDPSTVPEPRRCANCAAPLTGEYCPGCGQRDEPLRQPIRHFIAVAAIEYIGVDGRLWRTLALLFARPGALTREYLSGRRQRYLGPHRIYLTASVLFFFVLTILDPVGHVERATVGGGPDSTATVAERLAVIERRVEARKENLPAARPDPDSTDTGPLSALLAAPGNTTPGSPAPADAEPGDTTAGGLSLGDTARGDTKALRFVGRDELEEAFARPEVAAYVENIELRRLEWQQAVLDTLDRTRVIRPRDLDDAAALLFPDTTSIFRIGNVGIEAEGSSALELQAARTASERWDAFRALVSRAVSHLPLVMFLLVPVFAFLLKVLFVRTQWYYVEHLIFALHLHAHAFVVLTAASLLAGYFDGKTWATVLAVALLAWPPAYFLVALKHVYRRSWSRTLSKAWIIGLVYPIVLAAGVAFSIWLAAEFG